MTGRPPREIPLDAPAPDETPRAPRVIAIEATGGAADEDFADFDAVPPPPPPQRARTGWIRGALWSAIGGIAGLALFDWGWGLVASLSAKTPWLGDAALALFGLLALALLGFLVAEWLAILRINRATELRARAAAVLAAPADAETEALIAALMRFYADDPASTAGRQEMKRAEAELHDAPTMLVLAERALLKAKDAQARRAIADAAGRVSVVTAVAPRAIIDVTVVLLQSVALIRTLSSIYGGRASGLGLLRLAARVFGHLAVTGSVAMADQLVSQFLGAGLAARISAKLGEGVLNGVLTARIGISAVDLCRPLPFIECPPILLSEVVKSTITQD